jgi:hypothetical protein
MIRRRWGTWLTLGALMMTGLTAAPAARAQSWTPKSPGAAPSDAQIAEARERYDRGVKLYEVEGDVVGALIELKKAYDIAPNYRVLFNIGQVARTAREYVTSLRAFEAYLQYGGAEPDAARRAQVNAELESLRGLVANLEVAVDQPGAVVSIDDVEMGRSPLDGSLLVNAGRHRVTASLDGRTATKSVEIGGRERLKVELSIPASTAAPIGPAADPTTPPAESGGGGPSPYVWIGWGTAAAFTAGAVITGVIALGKESDLEEANFVGATPTEQLESDRSSMRTMSIVSDVFTGAAILTAGISLYFTISTSGDDPPATAAPSPGLRRVGVGSDRVTLEGAF